MCNHKSWNIYEKFPMAIITLALHSDTWTHRSEAPQLPTFMVRDTNKTLHSAGKSNDGLKILEGAKEGLRFWAGNGGILCWRPCGNIFVVGVESHFSNGCGVVTDVVCLSPAASRRDECGRISLMCHSFSCYNSRLNSTRIQIQCHSDAVTFGVYFFGKISLLVIRRWHGCWTMLDQHCIYLSN